MDYSISEYLEGDMRNGSISWIARTDNSMGFPDADKLALAAFLQSKPDVSGPQWDNMHSKLIRHVQLVGVLRTAWNAETRGLDAWMRRHFEIGIDISEKRRIELKRIFDSYPSAVTLRWECMFKKV